MLAASAASPTYKSPEKLVQPRTHYSLLSSIEKSKKCQPICARSLCCGIDDKKPGIILNESIENLLFDKKEIEEPENGRNAPRVNIINCPACPCLEISS
jgi:hypothetical protein